MRQGSAFEYNNHQKNVQLIKEAKSFMTPNSGAGSIKGDEQITGIIEIMEELKTKIQMQAPGKASFTIKKEWLDKLTREAQAANKDFWYLKFSFYEYDKDIYVAVSEEIIMSMVKTMIHDRHMLNIERAKADVADKRRLLAEAELSKKQVQIQLLEAQLSECRLLSKRGN